jgi:predicted phosphodiesterase
MGAVVILMSDIHGNLPALRAVIDSLPPYDEVIVAGDLCLEGPCPAGVVDTLDELGWSLIMGNTDRDIVERPASLKEGKLRQIDWTREQLGPDRLDRLAQLPRSQRRSFDGHSTLLAVHANPLNLDEHLYPTMSEEQLEPYLRDIDADILAFGHLHIPYLRPVAGVLLADVSSVGHPKDLDRRAAYTVLTIDGARRSVVQVRIPYDVEETVRLLRDSAMPDADKEAQSLLKASYG